MARKSEMGNMDVSIRKSLNPPETCFTFRRNGSQKKDQPTAKHAEEGVRQNLTHALRDAEV